MSRAPHRVVTTHVKNYSERVGQSGMGALVGIVIVGGAAVLLWWNEHRAVEQEQSLGEMKNEVVEASPQAVDPKHEGKWVHVTAPLTSDEFIRDEEYNVPPASSSSASSDSLPLPSAPPLPSFAPPAGPFSPAFSHPLPSSQPPPYEDVMREPRRPPFIRLRRETQMYQWIEKNERTVKNRTGGKQEVTTTTTYKKDWSGAYQDSAKFRQQDGHENPPCIPTPSATFQPNQAAVGNFLVSGSITQELEEKSVTPAAVQVAGMAPCRRVGDWIYITGSANRPPQVGDVRVRFFAAPQNELVSVVGRQQGQWLVSPSGEPNQHPLCRVGAFSAAEILESASRNLRTVNAVLRGLGIVLGIAGFRLFLDPVVMVGAVIPILSTFLGAGATAVSIPAGLALSLPTILAAWLHARLNYGVLRGLVKSLYVTYLVFFLIKLGKYLAQAASATGSAGLRSVRQLGSWWQTLWALYRRK